MTTPKNRRITERDRAIWRAATTLAHNFTVRDSNDINDRDGSLDAVHALSDCARKIRGWIEPTDEQLAELFEEGSVPEIGCGERKKACEPDWLNQAMNEGNGTYKP